MASAEDIRALLKEELSSLKQELLTELRKEQQFQTPRGLKKAGSGKLEEPVGSPSAEEESSAALITKVEPKLSQESERRLARAPSQNELTTYELIAQHPSFELLSISLVLTNIVWIGIQGEYAARTWTQHPPSCFHLVDALFCVGFVFENAVKIAAQGREFFCEMPAAKWNLFDFVSTLSQVVELMLLAIGGHASHSGGAMKLLRIFRLVRIARVANAFPDLKKLISSVAAALVPLGWTMLLVVLLTYAFALAVTQVVTDHKIAIGREDMEKHQDEVLEFFDTVARTFISFYMIISEGIHWGELMKPLAEHISPMFKPIFCLFVAFQIFAMMNVITAYFVESAFKAAAENEKKELTDDLLEVFRQDMSDSRRKKDEMWVTQDVFEKYSEHPKMYEFIELLGIDAEEGHHLWELIDSEGVGKIRIDDFVTGCCKLIGSARAENIFRLQFQVKQNHKQLMAVMAQVVKLQSSLGK